MTAKWSLCKIAEVWNLTTSVTGPSRTKFLAAPAIHREMQALSLLMIWPSLSFARDVFIECPALNPQRILKTWEKLLVWAVISRRSAWSFLNFRRSLRMVVLHSRLSLRYSAKFPERQADRRWSIIFRVSVDVQGFLGRRLIRPALHATDWVTSSTKHFQSDQAASARAPIVGCLSRHESRVREFCAGRGSFNFKLKVPTNIRWSVLPNCAPR